MAAAASGFARDREWARMAMWLLVVVAFANAVAFVIAACNPLVHSDNWTFVDTFLRIAIEDGAGFGDFLVKRAGVDHAQPLGKVLMLLNHRWFGLDFMLEGLVAMLFGLAGLLLLLRLVDSDVPPAERGALAYLPMAAIAAVYFSLNGTAIYTYSMVTLWFSLYLCTFLMMAAAWQALLHERLWPLALATLLFGIVGDDSAIMGVVATALAALLYAWHLGRWRQAFRVIAVMLVVLLLCRGLYAVFGEIRGTTKPEFNVSLALRVEGLWAGRQAAWRWIVVPLSSGLLSLESAQALFGAQALLARTTLAALVLVAHAGFWWASLRLRPSAAWFVAVALMLLFYAHVAGLLMARVFVRGAGYLDQPRYVSFYQLGIIALLLMAVAWLRAARSKPAADPADVGERTGADAGRRWLAAAALLVIMAQLPLTVVSRRHIEHVNAYYRVMAEHMGAMARDPLHPPAACKQGVDVCGMPVQQRLRLMRMLRGHQVNLFSPQFQRRHPELAAAAQLPFVDAVARPAPVVATPEQVLR